MTFEVSRQILEKPEVSKFIKIRPLVAELYEDGQRDRHEEANSFFSKAPNMQLRLVKSLNDAP